MEKLYITRLQIEKVRHLKNITIPLGENRMDHLIITGKNGSGKTSLLDAMATYLENVIVQNKVAMARSQERLLQNSLNNVKGEEKEKREYRLSEWKEKINEFTDGVEVTLNMPESKAARTYKEGNCILTYYKADRIFQADIPEYVEKIQLKSKYGINETPRKDFVKYLLDLKMTEALAVSGGKTEKAGQIREWFVKLEALLRKIFEDDTLTLEFDEETFQFFIHMSGREKFDFNSINEQI